jgi:hypothetical protein
MSRRLLQLVMPVFPDRRMFRLHDSAVDPNAPGAPLPPVGSLISVNREQLWIGSLQEQLDVRVVIEEWDGAPPPFGDTWQEEAKCRLYLRGYLSIDEGAVGKAIHGLRLASGVGDYAVRVYASNREEAARRYAELYDAYRNPLADEFQQAKKQLEGLERYLIQLWREYLDPGGPGAADAHGAVWPACGDSPRAVTVVSAAGITAPDQGPWTAAEALEPDRAAAGVPGPPAAAGADALVLAALPVFADG